ncbi:MAG: hypothetical protein AAGE94_25965, partial [Acidobacteriota bacterium]
MSESIPTDALSSIQSRVLAAIAELPWKRRRVRLLLGTDEHIPHETRVAFAPRHVRRLLDDLGSVGLEPEV